MAVIENGSNMGWVAVGSPFFRFMAGAAGEVEEAEDDVGDRGDNDFVEGADGLAQARGQGVEEGVDGSEGEEDAEAGAIQYEPELENPGSSGLSVDGEADEPGDDNGPEFVEMTGAATHIRVDVGIEDIEVVGGIEYDGGQEADKKVNTGFIAALHRVAAFLQIPGRGRRGTTTRK